MMRAITLKTNDYRYHYLILLFILTYSILVPLAHAQNSSDVITEINNSSAYQTDLIDRISFPDNESVNMTRTLILSDAYQEYFLSPYFTRYDNQKEPLSVKKIITARDIIGETPIHRGSIMRLGTDGGPIWLSVDIMNRAAQSEWKIDFGSQGMGRFGLLDNVTAYKFNISTNELTKIYLNEQGLMNLHLPKDTKAKFIIKLSFGSGMPQTIPLRIIDAEKPLSTQNNKLIIISLVFLIGMVFFYSAVAFMQSRLAYLNFSAYYGFFAALLATQNYFVESKFYFLGSSLIPLIFLCTAISGFMMARIFWRMEEKSRLMNGLFWGCMTCLCLVFMAGFFSPSDNSSLNYGLLYGPSLLLSLLIPVISFIQYQRNGSDNVAFMFGWCILLIGICITILSLGGIIPAISTAINSFWFTLIPQAFFFLTATKMKLSDESDPVRVSRALEIDETESISKLRQSRENSEQERLLKVIEQERKVLGELRKSEARRTEEMRIAKEEADAANTAKSSFLAVVSHEIRTPMTGIMGMVKLLLNSNLTREQKDYTQTIQDSSDAMLALLNDILDFEKIEQGQMVLEKIDFDIHRLTKGVSTLMNGHATQKNIKLHVKIGDKLPKYLKGDPTRLRQVLLNLTGNAVKFTTEGEVTITVEAIKHDTTSGNCEVYFAVTDSGVGISKEAQQKLFQPFSQADSSISRKFGGTGLGLAISKGLVAGMGSEININSNEGEGSTFFFTLTMPVGASDSSSQPTSPTVTTGQQSDRNILVVDDNEINQKVIKGFLPHHSLTQVMNAEDGLKALTQNKFDLILMDIELPGLKGHEATKEIRNSKDAPYKHIPIVALTGNTMPQNIDEYYAAGMNFIVPKPIDPDLLEKTIIKATLGKFDHDHRAPPKIAPPISPAPISKVIEGQMPEYIPQPPPPKVQAAEDVPENKADNLQPSNNVEVFNKGTIETLQGHISVKDIKEMLDDVIIKSEEIIDAMQKANAKNNMKELSAKAHELKGMTGNFGLMEISNHAGVIEAKSKTDAPIIITSLIAPLLDMQKRATQAIAEWLSNN